MISMMQGVLGLASGALVGFSLGLVGGGGSILAGVVLGATTTYIVDKQFMKAAGFACAGGVLTFFGLMHLTWSKLDGEHQLGKMLGIASGELLPMAARQLGIATDVSKLLSSCVGGKLNRTAAVPT